MNIHIAIILPPFANTVYQEMQKPHYDYSYISKILPTLKPIADKYNYSIYDFTDPTVLRLTDSDFFDGIHWSEAATAKAILEISTVDGIFSNYIDNARLNKQLEQKDSKARYLFPY